MYVCPNCNKTSETPINFCSTCGARMVEQIPVVEPVDQPDAKPLYESVCSQQLQCAQQPVYAPVKPNLGRVITGMALGIHGLAMSVLGLLYTFIYLGIGAGAGFFMGVFISGFSAPLSIIGLVMSAGCVNQGSQSGMCRAGKKTGLAGVIVTGVVLFFAFCGLIAM